MFKKQDKGGSDGMLSGELRLRLGSLGKSHLEMRDVFWYLQLSKEGKATLTGGRV